MHDPAGARRCLVLADTLLFAAALAVAVDQSVASALSRHTLARHWSSHQRQLVVVDRTGDPGWHQATRHAVDAWSRAAGETGLRLAWAAGPPGGGCRPGGTRVPVCLAPRHRLADDTQLRREGLAFTGLGPDRAQAHIGGAALAVCGDCRLGPGRRRVVATHELGHALGLDHTTRPGSVMFHTGGPDVPDAGDAAALRSRHDHADAEDRCGFFNVRAGPLCF